MAKEPFHTGDSITYGGQAVTGALSTRDARQLDPRSASEFSCARPVRLLKRSDPKIAGKSSAEIEESMIGLFISNRSAGSKTVAVEGSIPSRAVTDAAPWLYGGCQSGL